MTPAAKASETARYAVAREHPVVLRISAMMARTVTVAVLPARRSTMAPTALGSGRFMSSVPPYYFRLFCLWGDRAGAKDSSESDIRPPCSGRCGSTAFIGIAAPHLSVTVAVTNQV